MSSDGGRPDEGVPGTGSEVAVADGGEGAAPAEIATSGGTSEQVGIAGADGGAATTATTADSAVADSVTAQPSEPNAPAIDAGIQTAAAPADPANIAGLDSVQQPTDEASQDDMSPVPVTPPPAATAPPSAAFDTPAVPPIEQHAATVQEDASPAPEQPAGEPPLKPRVQMNRGSDGAGVAVPTGGADGGGGGVDRTPVELPGKNEPLDEGIEAEIAAAMGGAVGAAAASVASPGSDLPDISAAGQVTDAGGAGDVAVGQRLNGTVVSIHGDNVMVDLDGVRYAGVVPGRQFGDSLPEPGAKLEVVVDSVDDAQGNANCSIPTGTRKPGGNWDAVQVGQNVDVLVKKTNKGGLEVTVGQLRGFMPASQVDLGFVDDLTKFIGQKMAAKVLEVNPQRKKLVVSRRALLAEERKSLEKDLFENLEKGQTRTGTVKSIKDFGAFVDIGGADGLLHIGQISWSRINHPSDVLAVGQEVEVQILEVDPEKKKISLSMRQLQSNPWTLAEQTYPVGSSVTGKVTRVADFGAFVMLEPGVEGLVHISQLSRERVRAVSDVLSQGQEVEAKVMEVDLSRRRISLSIKAMQEPSGGDGGMGEGGMPPEDDPRESRRRQRRRNQNLRGGTGGSGKGGLFGNPNDFD